MFNVNFTDRNQRFVTRDASVYLRIDHARPSAAEEGNKGIEGNKTEENEIE